MKRITIRKMELKNFKNHSSLTVDFPSSGLGSIVVSGHNGSGKSSILEGIIFALGGSIEAGKILNQTTKAPASVSLTIEHTEGVDTYTRTLTPTLDASGKVTASTSSYVISGVPCKKTEYDIRINQLFGTKDWQYLLNPSLVPFLKDARAILLQVCNAPSERDFLAKSNPQLANIIGNTSFDEFEKREKATIQALGKKIDAIPGRIEENAAMLQEIPEMEDEAPIHQRIAEIREVLKGVDAENASRADQYNKVACEAQSLRNEAQKLRNMAAQKVAEANKAANKQIEEAEKICFEWRQTLNGLLREQDQIKAEMSEARQDQANKERLLAEVNAEIQVIANQCREISARVPSSDGQCSVCGVYCAQLQAKGIEAAIAANAQVLDKTKQKGRATVAQRDKLQADLEAIAKKIDGLMSQEHSNEVKITALSPEPKAPEREVITETPESLALIAQAAEMEEKAAAIIQGNRLDVTSHPAELVEELAALNEKLTRGTAIAQTRKNNDKIAARIEEIREEERQLIITQLRHKQHLAQLKDFYRNYAESVTAMVNGIFEGTGFEIRLFEQNMGNDKGTPVMNPMKAGSANLSTAENLIFWKLFAERVMSAKFGVIAPLLIDNAEGIDSTEKLKSNHQVIAARVERHELKIESIN